MSRSFKKNPVISIACCGKGKAMKSAKTQAVRKIRRTGHEDMPNGNYFKKLDERCSWPDDGKQRWESDKAYRK
jgi:hypothetical protein